MKRSSKLLCLLLALVMTCSMGLLTACEENPQEDVGVTSEEETASSGNEQQAEAPYTFAPEDRSAYTKEGASEVYLNASLYDLIVASDGDNSVLSLLKDYRMGDFFNIAMDELAKTYLSSMLGSQQSTAPAAFKFMRGDDGNWYNNYTAAVHPVLNKLLNYKVDGSEQLKLTFAELKTYENTSVLYVLKKSLTNGVIIENGVEVDKSKNTTNSLINGLLDDVADRSGGAIGALLNAPIPDLVDIIGGDKAAIAKVFGPLTLKEVAGEEIPELFGDITLNDLNALAAGESSFVDLFGNYTFGELAAAFGYELPESVAGVTVADAVSRTNDFGGADVRGMAYAVIGELDMIDQLGVDAYLEANAERTLGDVIGEYLPADVTENALTAKLLEVGFTDIYDLLNGNVTAKDFLMAHIGEMTVAEAYGVALNGELTLNPLSERIYALTMNRLIELEFAEEPAEYAEFMNELLSGLYLGDIVPESVMLTDALENIELINIYEQGIVAFADITLGEIMEAFNAPVDYEFADYASMTIAEIMAMVMPAEEGEIVHEAQPYLMLPIMSGEEPVYEEIGVEEGFDPIDLITAVLSGVVFVRDTYTDEETGHSYIMDEFTAADVFGWLTEIYYGAIGDDGKCTADSLYASWKRFIYGEYDEQNEEYIYYGNDETISYWMSRLDEEYLGICPAEEIVLEEAYVTEAVVEEEYEGDGIEGLDEGAPFCCPYFRSFTEAYGKLKTGVDVAYAAYSMVAATDVGDLIVAVTGIDSLEIYTGSASFDEYLQKVLDTPLGDVVNDYATFKAETLEALSDVNAGTLLENACGNCDFETYLTGVDAIDGLIGTIVGASLASIITEHDLIVDEAREAMTIENILACYGVTVEDFINAIDNETFESFITDNAATPLVSLYDDEYLKETFTGEAKAAFESLTVKDVCDILDLFGVTLPEYTADFIDEYGNYDMPSLKAMKTEDREAYEAFVAALKTVSESANDDAAAIIGEHYDFGNEKVNELVATLVALDRVDLTDSVLTAVLKKVTLKDLLESYNKIKSDFDNLTASFPA